MKHHSKALLVVNMQNDLCGGGISQASRASQVAQRIHQFVVGERKHYAAVVLIMDWHPPEAEKLGHGCIAGTEGAYLHPDLHFFDPLKDIKAHPGQIEADKCFLKGMTAFQISGFDARENGHQPLTEDQYTEIGSDPFTLQAFFERHDIDTLDIVGMEDNVIHTALDGRKHGYNVRVITSMTTPIHLADSNLMTDQGITVTWVP